ncbi:hypothetical protein CNECB9_4760013 [Cupriavidus necator]|uniref:Uncharacterized protein n=1 Tax=Cupriavidus necator TaxID=106590 RepID=A0A1K0ILW9_CUPNE|nr:hypothetical protein CNECB9_4760013 [Cupriavidus necator]
MTGHDRPEYAPCAWQLSRATSSALRDTRPSQDESTPEVHASEIGLKIPHSRLFSLKTLGSAPSRGQIAVSNRRLGVCVNHILRDCSAVGSLHYLSADRK